jgi:uncharacterized protein YggT (Ycf19 family)
VTSYDAREPADDGHLHPTRRAILLLARALTWLGCAYVLFVEVILSIGFFLLLFGSNPTSSFVDWIYRSLDRVMEPFRGIFTPIQLGTTAGNQVESIFETSVLFAMVAYGILGLAGDHPDDAHRPRRPRGSWPRFRRPSVVVIGSSGSLGG